MPSLQLGAMWHPGPCIILRNAFRFSVVVASIITFPFSLLWILTQCGQCRGIRLVLFTTLNTDPRASLGSSKRPSFQHGVLESRLTWMSPEASLQSWMPAIHGMTKISTFILYGRA